MSDVLLKRSLSGRLGWVTRTVTEIEGIVGQIPIDKETLKVQLGVLKERWQKYEETYTKLEDALIEAQKTDAYDNESKAYEDNVDNYIKNLKKFEGILAMSQSSTLSANSDSRGSELIFPKLQLPVLTLPEFNGDENWVSFWDKFRNLVHDRTDVSQVNKFTYLLGQLKGPAYELVSELSITDTSYDVALKILQENFEDKDLILKNLVYKLIDLPSPAHNLKDLQSFRVTLSCTLKSRTLTQLLV